MKHILYTFFISLLLISCLNSTQKPDLIPTHDSFTIQSKNVGEKRVINVWTPSEYKSNNDSLPVLYMADGGLKEDFPHIANTISQLIKSKTIPPMILVGIENTQRRRDLTGPTTVAKDKEIAAVVGGSEKFRAFINEELFSEIDKKYRTSGKKGIIGESASGLFIVETFLLKPEMFDFYIAFDPSLWWNNQYLVKNAEDYLDKFPSSKKIIWLASSNTEEIAPFTKEFVRILKKKKLPNVKFEYSDEPKEEHSTIFRATKVKALIWTLGK